MRLPMVVRYGDGHDAGRVYGIYDADGTRLVETDAGYYPPEPDVAERIVLCVNALAGVPTEILAALPPDHLRRVVEITKGWDDREFNAIDEITSGLRDRDDDEPDGDPS